MDGSDRLGAVTLGGDAADLVVASVGVGGDDHAGVVCLVDQLLQLLGRGRILDDDGVDDFGEVVDAGLVGGGLLQLLQLGAGACQMVCVSGGLPI